MKRKPAAAKPKASPETKTRARHHSRKLPAATSAKKPAATPKRKATKVVSKKPAARKWQARGLVLSSCLSGPGAAPCQIAFLFLGLNHREASHFDGRNLWQTPSPSGAVKRFAFALPLLSRFACLVHRISLLHCSLPGGLSSSLCTLLCVALCSVRFRAVF